MVEPVETPDRSSSLSRPLPPALPVHNSGPSTASPRHSAGLRRIGRTILSCEQRHRHHAPVCASGSRQARSTVARPPEHLPLVELVETLLRRSSLSRPLRSRPPAVELVETASAGRAVSRRVAGYLPNHPELRTTPPPPRPGSAQADLDKLDQRLRGRPPRCSSTFRGSSPPRWSSLSRPGLCGARSRQARSAGWRGGISTGSIGELGSIGGVGSIGELGSIGGWARSAGQPPGTTKPPAESAGGFVMRCYW